ncbi:hypothetical protein TcYC6_0062610 [Trypanosoma cruzi]|nr:hypothetical protein TcYC6_0062610 [Trypanosoma cruzi]
MDATHPRATYAARSEEIARSADGRQKRQRGCPPLMGAEDGSPIHSTTSHQSSQAAHRAADAPSDILNCPTQSLRRAMELIRQRRSTVVRRNTDIPALSRPHKEGERCGLKMWAPSTWKQRMSLAGNFQRFFFCRRHEQPMNKESCAALLMGILDVAPSTRPRHTRMLRFMLEMNRTPLEMVILGLQKIAARSETKQARPLTKEGMGQFIHSRTDWKERVVFRLVWITASCLFEIAALTPNSFTLERDGTIILYWPVAPKTARADPHRASRFVGMRGQGALDTIKLCRTLQENEKLTNITAAHVGRALAPWGATAHSIKQGLLRHAAPIVDTYNLDPHVISQLARHGDPFDLPQDTV